MAYGTYMNNYNTNPYTYMGNNYQQNVNMQQQYDLPFQGVVFLTSDEAKAYIVPPNSRVMIMDRDKSIFYIKSADALGQSNTTAYSFKVLENEQPKIENDTVVVNDDYVKKEDIKSFATIDDLQNLRNDLFKMIENIKEG